MMRFEFLALHVLCAGANLLESGDLAAAPEHSCDGVIDMLVDWHQLREDLSAVLDEVLTGGNAILKYWQHIRPQTHTLDNIATFTVTSQTFASCRVGYFAVKAFMTAWSPQREELTWRLAEDWQWFLSLPAESLERLLASAWGYVLFASWLLLFPGSEPCTDRCPALGAAELLELGHLAEAQSALRQVDRSGGLGLVRALTAAPLARALLGPSAALRAEAGNAGADLRMRRARCRFQGCALAREATPLDATCACGRLFPRPRAALSACIFMVDSRPVEPMRNITEVLASRYWSLAYEANRLYAEHHGYSIDYVIPDESLHYPSRKVGWAKVKVILDQMEARLPGSDRGCDIAVSIDTDAYFRGTERLEGVVEQYMEGKEILFSQEYHTEERPGQIHINGGFFIVRNTDHGRELLRAWYAVPEMESHKLYKKENAQGLNFCWDSAMHPEHSQATVLAPYEYFSCPRGQFIRHNWFKDLSFEAELQEAVLQRWAETSPGCVLCGEFHLIDLVRHESGKGWINNR